MTETEGYLEVEGGRVWYRSVGEGGHAAAVPARRPRASPTTTWSPWRRWPTGAR